jgi:glutamine---fructose-6-phosphate transaminase (isomerizing)
MVGTLVINELMLRDIRSQGDALAQGLLSFREQLSEAELPGQNRIVLTGSGDSFIAATVLQPLFQAHRNVPVLALPSLDASRYLTPNPSDLVVVLSVSGEVARSIEVARRAGQAGASTIAVTAAGDSTLGVACDLAIEIPAPIDRSIPHSRDYTVMLLALACLLEGLASTTFDELAGLSSTVADLVTRSLEMAASLRASTGRTWFLGAGPDRATAMFGALKFWEAAGMEAWWDDLEEFGHGSQLMARPGDRAVLIASGAGCQRALEMAGGLERMGMDVVLVGGTSMRSSGRPQFFTTDDLDPRWHPFVSCVPLQALTYVEAEARGLDVAIPLDGQSFGPTYSDVHDEWTKQSRVVLTDGLGS